MIDNYNKLTIGKYLELLEIIEEDSISDIDKNVEIIALLDDKEVDMIYDLPLPEFNEKIQKTAFLYEEPKPLQVSTVYKLGGMELEACLNINDLTTAQFIDYQTYVKDKNKIVELLSVFLIPKGHKYTKDYDVFEVQKMIRNNMPITQAMGLSDFFLLLYKSLLKASLISSTRKLKKMMRKEKDMKKKEMMKQAIQGLQLNGLG